MIEECEEVLPELASNPQWSRRTGEFRGNFDDRGDVVRHFTPESFFLWMGKAGVDDFDVVAGENEVLAQFVFEGKNIGLENIGCQNYLGVRLKT